MSTIKVATVFSGIGAIEQALKNLNIEHEIEFACDNGNNIVEYEYEEEIEKIRNCDTKFEQKDISDAIYSNKNNVVKTSYLANYSIIDDMFYQDIRLIDGTKYRGQINLFVGGSPCQSFSVMGKRKGLKDVRGTLFFEFARLIDEIQPDVFIYENVPGILTIDKGKTWETILGIFQDLGYNYNFEIMNAVDHGIPQNRKRVIVVGVKNGDSISFNVKRQLQSEVIDYLEQNIDEKYYLGKKGFEFTTNPKYKNRAKINSKIAICQKACQQYNWNGDFRFEETKSFIGHPRIHTNVYNEKVGVIRKLTPRECLRLMGFRDDFNIVVNDINAYKQAGNSIVVNVLEDVLKELYKMGD